MLVFQFIYVVVNYLLTAINIAFIVRAVLSWIMPDADNVFIRVALCLTEIFVAPYRVLFEKKGWFQGLPLDMAFFAGYMSAGFLSLLIMTIYENIIW